MRRLWAWILTAALLLGIAAPAGAWMTTEDVYAAYIAAKDNIQGITIRTPTVKVGESAGIMITLKDGTNVQNISAKIAYSSATSNGSKMRSANVTGNSCLITFATENTSSWPNTTYTISELTVAYTDKEQANGNTSETLKPSDCTALAGQTFSFKVTGNSTDTSAPEYVQNTYKVNTNVPAPGGQVTISADFTDDTAVKSLTLYVENATEKTTASYNMAHVSGNTYSASFTAANKMGTVYFPTKIVAEDTKGHSITLMLYDSTSNDPNMLYFAIVVTDPTKITEETASKNTAVSVPTATKQASGKSNGRLVNYDDASKAIAGDCIGYSLSKVAKDITKLKKEEYAGAGFAMLQAYTSKIADHAITLKWRKLTGISGYVIYGAKCGKKNKFKKLATVKKSKSSWTHKKLKKGTYYKYIVVAYHKYQGKNVAISASSTIHAATGGGTVGNYASVTAAKQKVTLKKGKKHTVKAKAVPSSTVLKVRNHRKLMYASTDPSIASVSKKGVVKAKKKGKCYVLAYAQNGVYDYVEVTVK